MVPTQLTKNNTEVRTTTQLLLVDLRRGGRYAPLCHILSPSEVLSDPKHTHTHTHTHTQALLTQTHTMSEGGCLAWKRQTIDTHRGPAATFDAVHRPLPPPPKGMHWIQDVATKEWKVVPKQGEEEEEPEIAVVEGIVMTEPLLQATVVQVVQEEEGISADGDFLKAVTPKDAVTTAVIPKANLVGTTAATQSSLSSSSIS